MPDHLERLSPADRLQLLAFDAELRGWPRSVIEANPEGVEPDTELNHGAGGHEH